MTTAIGLIDGRLHNQVYTNKRTHVHSTWSSLVVTHSSTNQGQRATELALVATPDTPTAKGKSSLLELTE